MLILLIENILETEFIFNELFYFKRSKSTEWDHSSVSVFRLDELIWNPDPEHEVGGAP